jgi:hypothetical protein
MKELERYRTAGWILYTLSNYGTIFAKDHSSYHNRDNQRPDHRIQQRQETKSKREIPFLRLIQLTYIIGIGKGLLSAYLSRPNHIVIAGLRDPTSASSKSLHDLPHGTNSKLIIVKIDSASDTDALAAMAILKSDHNITKLDIVTANAGISNYFGKAAATPAQQMFEHSTSTPLQRYCYSSDSTTIEDRSETNFHHHFIRRGEYL